MSFRARLLMIAWCTTLSIGVAACGGSGGVSKTATPEATAPPATTVAALPTTAPSFAVSEGIYTFADKGYSVHAPDGWQAHADVSFDVSGARFPSDVFFAAEVVGEIQPSISISCLKPRADQATSEAFRDGWRAFLKQLLQIDVTPTISTADQGPAFVFAYVQNQTNSGTTNADRMDVVFVSGGCRWMITLLVPAGQREKYLAILDGVTASFHSLR